AFFFEYQRVEGVPAGHLQGERDRVAAFVVELRGPRATEFEAARDGHARRAREVCEVHVEFAVGPGRCEFLLFGKRRRQFVVEIAAFGTARTPVAGADDSAAFGRSRAFFDGHLLAYFFTVRRFRCVRGVTAVFDDPAVFAGFGRAERRPF